MRKPARKRTPATKTNAPAPNITDGIIEPAQNIEDAMPFDGGNYGKEYAPSTVEPAPLPYINPFGNTPDAPAIMELPNPVEPPDVVQTVPTITFENMVPHETRMGQVFIQDTKPNPPKPTAVYTGGELTAEHITGMGVIRLHAIIKRDYPNMVDLCDIYNRDLLQQTFMRKLGLIP